MPFWKFFMEDVCVCMPACVRVCGGLHIDSAVTVYEMNNQRKLKS